MQNRRAIPIIEMSMRSASTYCLPSRANRSFSQAGLWHDLGCQFVTPCDQSQRAGPGRIRFASSVQDTRRLVPDNPVEERTSFRQRSEEAIHTVAIDVNFVRRSDLLLRSSSHFFQRRSQCAANRRIGKWPIKTSDHDRYLDSESVFGPHPSSMTGHGGRAIHNDVRGRVPLIGKNFLSAHLEKGFSIALTQSSHQNLRVAVSNKQGHVHIEHVGNTHHTKGERVAPRFTIISLKS
jgi:hypothetical protein